MEVLFEQTLKRSDMQAVFGTRASPTVLDRNHRVSVSSGSVIVTVFLSRSFGSLWIHQYWHALSLQGGSLHSPTCWNFLLRLSCGPRILAGTRLLRPPLLMPGCSLPQGRRPRVHLLTTEAKEEDSELPSSYQVCQLTLKPTRIWAS